MGHKKREESEIVVSKTKSKKRKNQESTSCEEELKIPFEESNSVDESEVQKSSKNRKQTVDAIPEEPKKDKKDKNKRKKELSETSEVVEKIEEKQTTDLPQNDIGEITCDLMLNVTSAPSPFDNNPTTLSSKERRRNIITAKRSGNDIGSQIKFVGETGNPDGENEMLPTGTKLKFKYAKFGNLPIRASKNVAEAKRCYRNLIKGDILLQFINCSLHEIPGYAVEENKR